MSPTASASSISPASRRKTALLLVDIQAGLTTGSGFYGTQRSTPRFEDNITSLLSSIRSYNSTTSSHNVLIIHVFHRSTIPESPLHPSNPTTMAFMPCATPIDGEPVFGKTTNNTFLGTELESLLRREGVRQLLVCGIASDHCVSTTVRMAADLRITDNAASDGVSSGAGLVALISDASAAFNNPRGRFDAETVHAVNVASLEDEFAEIVTTKEVLDGLFAVDV